MEELVITINHGDGKMITMRTGGSINNHYSLSSVSLPFYQEANHYHYHDVDLNYSDYSGSCYYYYQYG